MRKTRRNMARQSVVVCLAIVLLSCSVTAMANGLQVWLDRIQIGEGQSVGLHLMTEANTAGEPDLSPLRKDFDILSINQGSYPQVPNGQASNMRTWRLTLTPKRPGRLTVPMLRVGQATSSPLELEVLSSEKVPSNRVLREVMLQTNVSQQRPYVQGKVIYTLRLYTRLDLRQVHFSEPEVLGTIVERLGEDRKYDTYFGRYRYHVLQRRFVLFPQRSGRLSVISPLLNARVREDKRPDWPLQMRGPEITLEVQPPPDPTLDPWLPAESLRLSETWSTDPPDIRVGEPVHRNIAITAQGVSAVQLPELPQLVPQGINLYTERPVTTTRAFNDTLLTQKVLNYSLIAKQAGNYRLPEISLTWWDTNTGERRTEVLAARDIVVLPGTEPDKDEPQQTESIRPFSDIDLGAWWQSVRNVWKDAITIWPWLILLFVLAWLTGMILRWRGRRTRSAEVPPEPVARVQSGQAAVEALRHFENACKRKDPHLAREALIDWAAATWPNDPPQRLDRLAKRLPPRAAEFLTGIDRALYAPTDDTWDGIAAFTALQPLLQDGAKDQGAKQDTQALPPLYPE